MEQEINTAEFTGMSIDIIYLKNKSSILRKCNGTKKQNNI